MTSDLHVCAHTCVCDPTYKLVCAHTHTYKKQNFKVWKLNKDTKIQWKSRDVSCNIRQSEMKGYKYWRGHWRTLHNDRKKIYEEDIKVIKLDAPGR